VRTAFAAQLTEIDVPDSSLDRLHRELFACARDLDGPAARRSVAMRQVLIARSIERIGDNALGIARQAAFVVAGSPATASTAGSDS
jgi:phosphate uptake regulator